MNCNRRFLLSASGALATLTFLSPANALQGPSRKIGVIGAGSLGGTVGGVWVQAGHEVRFSSRHPEELLPMTQRLGPRASAGTASEAAAFGEIVLFAVPYAALQGLGRELQARIRGKVVLDACNTSGAEYEALARETGSKTIGELSSKLLPGTRLVRTFSSEDATAVAASFAGRRDTLAIPVAGDDSQAVAIAAQLVRDARCEPVIVGGLATSVKFQRGTPAFRAATSADKLRRLLDQR